MSVLPLEMGKSPQVSSLFSSTVGFIVRLIFVAILDVIAFWLAIGIWQDGNGFLAIAITLAALGVSAINIWSELWPLRWMSPGLVLMALLAVYPLFYTVYIAFTNFSDGHRMTKAEAIRELETRREYKYLPAEGSSYQWELYRSEDGAYALWLSGDDGSTFFAEQGQPLLPVTVNQSGEAPFNEDGLPTTINGYQLLERRERAQAMTRDNLQEMQFGDAETPVGIKSRTEAGGFLPKWIYDPGQNAMIDRETNTLYPADETTGEFVTADGQQKAPLGYWVPVGFRNFTRIFEDIAISGPLIRVFLWTIGFALFSVLSSFALGLTVAVVLNKTSLPYKIVKSVMVIPYAVPGVISILIWRGMLNPNGGIIIRLFPFAPDWYNDAGWAKIAILLVNLWLSFPYFMLICSGALQAIPSSIYEAAEVDGANAWQKFWSLTLPLLLVAVGPLLIGSFIFNFNNFMIIDAMFGGGPSMIGTTAPPVGHTDNLISYTFRFAFSSSGGSRNFGFASAIAIIIFFIVGTLSIIQFRLSKRFEEVGENV